MVSKMQLLTRKQFREQVFERDNNRCVICGEPRLACLSIDHINGGGTEHRKELARKGSSFYDWIKRLRPELFEEIIDDLK